MSSSSRNRKCAGEACTSMIENRSVSGLCGTCYRKTKTAVIEEARIGKPVEVQVQEDREKRRLSSELSLLKAKYSKSQETIESLEASLHSLSYMRETPVQTFDIKPSLPSGKSEGTVVWVASDWHVEERVDPKKISGLNTYTLPIAKARGERFFKSGLRLTKLLQQDITIKNIVLALLGDFLSNDIHEEFPELNQLPPMLAAVYARDIIISGIKFVLENTPKDVKIKIVAHSGNHGRTTRTSRMGEENGHSIEWLMYLLIEAEFRAEPRVEMLIADGMHSYIDVYDTKIRFHHGHTIRYVGGVGGITIPVYKAIAQWNRARKVDLDVFGHFHQLRDGGNFICNGSMIGYNAFALSIKADYEPPKQALFLIDKKRGRTCTWPILFNE